MGEAADFDVVIVGGGPAGIAAAIALKKRGLERIAIVEREAEIGGVPRHCGHPPFGMREFGRVLTGPAYAARLRATASTLGIALRLQTTVVALGVGGRLHLTAPKGPGTITARRVILATGARETPRAARLISGDRPIGVLTTGTLQHSIYLERTKPFARPVIVGTELVSLSAVLTCWKAGIRPVAVIESDMRPVARKPMHLFPRLLGIPVHYGAELVDIKGPARVSSITVRLTDGSDTEMACDGVLLTGRFVPESALVRSSHLALDPGSGGPDIDQFGRCSDAAYFAAGNLLRPVETAGWSFREGARIGNLVADDLAGALPAGAAYLKIGHDDTIKLAVPQRIDLTGGGGLRHIQLRVTEGGRGQLSVEAGGRVFWRRRVAALPERRLLIPIAAIGRAAGDYDGVTVRFKKG
ncbi:FAD-dependent oxidoreductase [Nitratireductor sp. StC3]|uniref:FAD-dependent oxidoreductase n=1 Tax=Nitratireductor sp. StC3 TaxID=2126741 RepID=UPI000D0CFCEA|nr:FAD-dependent oxidoreductase [Nitratireductor sp. StC3]PSM15931.1 pyridine nucleotide-disulfide oxidoreductase [Nitratireductor sp. StC3]